MTQFKNWLLKESSFGGGGSGGASWDLLYPTSAGDYPYASSSPVKHFFLQWKWDRGTDPDIGRTLYNIDNDDFQKRGYVGIESTTIPDLTDEFWKHKEDDNKSSIKPFKLQDLKWLEIGKTHKETKYHDSKGASKVKVWAGPHGPTNILDDTDLDKIFHDGERQTNRWPTIDTKYMDEEWVMPKHRPIKESVSFKKWMEYGGSGGAATSLMHGGILAPPFTTTNDNMPVRSKYSTANGQSKYEDDTRPRTDKNGNPSTVDSEWLGDKRTPLSKRPRERRSMWIDRNRRGVPTRDDRPDIVY